MKWIDTQFKQTIIGTAAVGLLFSSVAAIGILLATPGSNARRVANGLQPLHWSETALNIADMTLVLTIGSIALFGVVPTAIGKLIGYGLKVFSKDA